MPFIDADRREGRAAMERSLSTAQKVIRRMIAGRKPQSELLNWKDAGARAIAALSKLEALALESDPKLKSDDIRVSIVYHQPTGNLTRILPLEDTGKFF